MHWSHRRSHRRLPACMTPKPARTAWALLVGLLVLSGCATTRAPVDLTGWDPRENTPICDGADGSPATWADLVQAASAADVIILGEMHDDARGHRVQLAILEEMLERFPKTALSMEMLDRRKQATVDDYLAGLIDLDTFHERIAMTRWRKTAIRYLNRKINRKKFKRAITRIGWPDWEHNYQPIIDAAKSAGSPVVAANTPWLLYSTLGGKEGYDRLDSLTDAQKRLFERPYEEYQGSYRKRFWKVIVGRPEAGTEDDAEDAATESGESDTSESARAEQQHANSDTQKRPAPVEKADDESKPDGEKPAHEGLSDEAVERMYRGQLVMDATMAASMADALAGGVTKVVHLVGQFHCDFTGGLVQELRRRVPEARILVISLQPREDPTWTEKDQDRADFIAFTGSTGEE